MIRYFTLTCIFIGIFLPDLLAQTYYVYWTESCDGIGVSCVRSINRSDLDGSNPVALISNTNAESSSGANDALSDPEDIKIDNANGKMYWTDSNNQNIRRADLDGQNVELIYTTTDAVNQDSPGNIDLDISGGYIYWTDISTCFPKLRRVPFNFANPAALPVDNATVETIYQNSETAATACATADADIDQPNGLAIDAANGHVYWSDKGSGKNWIRRCNLDGSNQVTIIGSLAEPQSIVLDVADNKIYWSDEGFSAGNRRIRYANLDGSSPTDLVTNASNGILNAQGITIDLLSGTKRVYWTDIANSASHIKRIRLSNNVESTVATGLNHPTDVVIGTGVDCVVPRGFLRN